MHLQLHQSPCGNTWSEGKFKSRTLLLVIDRADAHTTWYSCEVSLGVSWMCSDYWLWYIFVLGSLALPTHQNCGNWDNSWLFIPSEVQTLLLTASALWIDAVKGGIEIWQEQECRWKRAKAVPANRQAHKKCTTWGGSYLQVTLCKNIVNWCTCIIVYIFWCTFPAKCLVCLSWYYLHLKSTLISSCCGRRWPSDNVLYWMHFAVDGFDCDCGRFWRSNLWPSCWFLWKSACCCPYQALRKAGYGQIFQCPRLSSVHTELDLDS